MRDAERAQQRTSGWVIGRIGGAPVILAPSLLVLAAVLTVLFAPVVSQYAPQVAWSTAIGVAFCFALLLFVSVFLHELAHGLVATWRGHRVQEYAITLLGGHTQFSSLTASPGTTALIAVVGPLTNIVLGVACWLAFLAAPERSLLALLLLAGAGANGFVGVFNLIPGLPLDGGRILEAAVWKASGDRPTGMIVAGWSGRVVAVAISVVLIGRDVVEGRAPTFFSIAWVLLIALTLWFEASRAIHMGHGQRAAATMSIERVAERAVGVPETATVADAEATAAAAGADRFVILAPDGRPAAYVDHRALAEIPLDRRPVTPVSAVAIPLPVGAVISGDLDGQALVQAVAEVSRFSPVMAVVQGAGTGYGTVSGLLDARTMIAALRRQATGPRR